MLVKVYRDDSAPGEHKKTAHYQIWRDTVTEMMAELRQKRRSWTDCCSYSFSNINARPLSTAASGCITHLYTNKFVRSFIRLPFGSAIDLADHHPSSTERVEGWLWV